MNPNSPSQPEGSSDLSAINDRVTIALHSHRLKLRVLTAATFLFGFLAVTASIGLVMFYQVFYLPKQKQMLRDAELAVRQARTNPPAGEASVQEAVKRIDKFLGVQIILTHVVSMGTTILAGVVGLLGFGTLVLLTVVLLSRRATLNQINASLAQISAQLRQLPPRE